MAAIGIVGFGIVGQAVKHGFEQKNKAHSFLVYDKYKNIGNLADVAKESDFIFICLPTPSSEKGIDLSVIDRTLDEIAKLSELGKIIVIKSTAVPGTNKMYSKLHPKMQFVSNPEFLREASYLDDAANQDRIVIGSENEEAKRKVFELYKADFPDARIFLCSSMEAEMVKYSANCFLATKVIFANEIFELCSRLGIDYGRVCEIFSSDARIGNSHLNVSNERGFGGKCFPKDIQALIEVFEANGIDASMLKSVWRKNLMIRKVRDWENIPGTTSENKNNFA